MVNDKDFLKMLLDKEAELQDRLEQSELWKQIAGIRTTIEVFGKSESSPAIPENTFNTDNTNSEGEQGFPVEGTWGEKIIFVLNRVNFAYVPDIMGAIRMYEPGKYEEEVLYKRVSQTASTLKSEGKIEGVKSGTKVRYFRK